VINKLHISSRTSTPAVNIPTRHVCQ